MTEANKSAHEYAQNTTILDSEEKAVRKVEENEEQIEPPPIQKLSNDKEMSTEAHSFVTIPLETYLEPQVSSFQCLEEPSYVEIFKESLAIAQHIVRNIIGTIESDLEWPTPTNDVRSIVTKPLGMVAL